jgi:DNA-binding helix-turn-helix protein
MDTIGQRLKSRRIFLGIKRKDICSMTGISSGNLSELENDNKCPSAQALISLSNALDCTTDWILTGRSDNQEFVPTSYEEIFLCGFRNLNKNDQNELIDFLNFLLQRTK